MSADIPKQAGAEPSEPQQEPVEDAAVQDETLPPGGAEVAPHDDAEDPAEDAGDGAEVAPHDAGPGDDAEDPAEDAGDGDDAGGSEPVDVRADEPADDDDPPAVDDASSAGTDDRDADGEPPAPTASAVVPDATARSGPEVGAEAVGEAEPLDPGAHEHGDDPEGARWDAGQAAEPSGWRRLGTALRPRLSRSHVLAGVLCAALGFALVVQVQQSASDQLSSARQEDLVRLLDEVTDRAEQLAAEVSGLEATRDELLSGSGQAQSALELAQQRAESEGILSGRLPAEGPGVRVRIADPGAALEAAQLFNVLEELRNAGAEVVELNGVRLVTSTWFRDQDGAIVVDGQKLSSPYEWTVIGDPQTMDRALEIPGGALATVRTAGAEATTTTRDKVQITAVREPAEPEHATPQGAGK
ncbi:hypothetical protein GCM10009809_34210 [Isoptericola hypogeus]|uniref:DUF881 domain-containing protein n=1 Tax=Isoptericola hypogeus TaxID=300179 RepID=A0ABN2JRD6_9MICO